MVACAGGKTGSTGWYSPGAKATLALWKKIDQCTGSPVSSRQYCEGYTACAAGVEVTLCSLPNTGHDTYNNAVGMNVPDVAGEMLQRQPMPQSRREGVDDPSTEKSGGKPVYPRAV